MGDYNQEETEDVLWDVLLYIKNKYKNSTKLVTWEKYKQEAQILIEVPIFNEETVVGIGYIKILAEDILEASTKMTRWNLYRGIDNTLRPYIKRFGDEK